MTAQKHQPCSQWDSSASNCKSGHVGASPICYGIASNLPPPCTQENRPNHLIRDDGYPIGWAAKP